MKIHHIKLFKELIKMRGKGDQGRHPMLTSGLLRLRTYTYAHEYSHIHYIYNLFYKQFLMKLLPGFLAAYYIGTTWVKNTNV